MPTVPTYTPDQVQLSTESPANVQGASEAEQYVQLGAAVQHLGATATDIAIDQQHQANMDAVLKTEAAFKNDYLAYQNSISDRRGQNAWGVTDEVKNWFDKNGSKYADGLTNDAQKRAFASTFQAVRTQGLESAGRFEAEQRRISTEQSGQASIVSSINLAAADHNNQATIDGARSDIVKRVEALGLSGGWSVEVRDAQIAQYLTDLHKRVITARVDQDPASALSYYLANKAEIAGTEQAPIEHMLIAGKNAAVAQGATQQIMNMGLSEAAALKLAREKFSGAQQDEVVRRVTERYAESDALRERDQRNAADTAWDIYARTGSVTNVPPSVLTRMDGKALDALTKDSDARAAGKDTFTDWGRFYELRDFAVQEPGKFAQLDLRNEFPKLAPEQRAQLIEMQGQVRKPAGLNDVAQIGEQLSVAHASLGLDSSRDGIAQRGLFDSAALFAIQAESDRLGRKLSFQERQSIIDRLMISGRLDGNAIMDGIRDGPVGQIFGWDRSRKLYQVINTPDVSGFKVSPHVQDVPANDRQKIVDALTRAQQPVTDDNIVALWTAKLRRDGLVK
ncbi:MAG: hypothetical protein JSR64_13240 [Nitrospira sp.]|nr:hypothetical protein [Nitrospira sp.]